MVPIIRSSAPHSCFYFESDCIIVQAIPKTPDRKRRQAGSLSHIRINRRLPARPLAVGPVPPSKPLHPQAVLGKERNQDRQERPSQVHPGRLSRSQPKPECPKSCPES